jgi:hypothetical protein
MEDSADGTKDGFIEGFRDWILIVGDIEERLAGATESIVSISGNPVVESCTGTESVHQDIERTHHIMDARFWMWSCQPIQMGHQKLQPAYYLRI